MQSGANCFELVEYFVYQTINTSNTDILYSKLVSGSLTFHFFFLEFLFCFLVGFLCRASSLVFFFVCSKLFRIKNKRRFKSYRENHNVFFMSVLSVLRLFEMICCLFCISCNSLRKNNRNLIPFLS